MECFSRELWLGCVGTAGAGLCRPEPNSRTHTLQLKVSRCNHVTSAQFAFERNNSRGEKHTRRNIFHKLSIPCTCICVHACVCTVVTSRQCSLALHQSISVSEWAGWMDGWLTRRRRRRTSACDVFLSSPVPRSGSL